MGQAVTPESATLLQYRVPNFLDAWTVTDVPVPEAAWHADAVSYLEALLQHWVAATGQSAAVYRNLAIRVREDRPKVGFDPDLCLVTPAPPRPRDVSSLCIWKDDHAPPALCIEVVSPGHPSKDYLDIPARCAVAGVHELWIFDPKLSGRQSPSGPHLFQLFARQPDGAFQQLHAGSGPAFSPLLQAWCVPTQEALAITTDASGRDPWLTGEEAERRAKEAERHAKEAEHHAKEAVRAARDVALARVAELEAELARRRG